MRATTTSCTHRGCSGSMCSKTASAVTLPYAMGASVEWSSSDDDAENRGVVVVLNSFIII